MSYSPIFFLVLFLNLSVVCAADAAGGGSDNNVVEVVSPAEAQVVLEGVDANDTEYFADDWLEDDYAEIQVADPLEPLNRLFFHFNDKLYFWLLRPVARTYGFVTPKPVRQCVSNFFYNLQTPIRLVNNLLQGKFSAGGTELTRFVVNTTIGVAGLWDPARNWFDMSASEEDFGQTLGKYGIGEGFYICWPVLGPSNFRDSLGLAGDYFLDPVAYLNFNGESEEAFALKSSDTINQTSLSLGDYEAFKDAAFDPYSAMRDAYFQQRRTKIKDGADQ